jgi:hypothetical protein
LHDTMPTSIPYSFAKIIILGLEFRAIASK